MLRGWEGTERAEQSGNGIESRKLREFGEFWEFFFLLKGIFQNFFEFDIFLIQIFLNV